MEQHARTGSGSGTSTRQRILDESMRLFLDQGYDATSLREIADQLGITKAALYYHFKSKEQILAALYSPFDRLTSELVDRLTDSSGPEQWAAVLEWLVNQIPDNLELFRLATRNRRAVAALHEQGLRSSDPKASVELAIAGQDVSDRVRIRMIAALAAVTGVDEWAPLLLSELPVDTLVAELTATVRAILLVGGSDAHS